MTAPSSHRPRSGARRPGAARRGQPQGRRPAPGPSGSGQARSQLKAEKERRARRHARLHLAGWLAAIAAVAGLITATALSVGSGQGTAQNSTVRTAPGFTLTSTSGSQVSLASYRGHDVVLYFNEGVGCDACFYQMREFENHAAELAQAGITLVPIVINPAGQVRVAYVDYDPVVVLHSQVILKDKSKRTAVIEADLPDPKSIIDHPRVRKVIDFTQPVAVLLFAILHFITDDEKPQEILRQFTDAMAPGSYLALSHITDDDIHDERSRAAQQVYQGASAPAVPRSHGQIMQFFDGLQIIDPGLTDIRTWPGSSPHIAPSAPRLLYGGIAKKKAVEAAGLAASCPNA